MSDLSLVRRIALVGTAAIVALLASSSPVQAAPGPDVTAQIDAVVKRFAALPTVPSVSIAVVRDGEIVYLKSFGYRDLDTKAAATPDTVYDLASLSKQFTAAAFFMLVREGKIDPRAPLSAYLPDMPHAAAVTVAQVVGMTSGYQDIGEPAPSDVAVTAALPLLFEPGTQFGYSNTNYELMALLIERAAGMPFQTFVRQRIVEPLALASWSMQSSMPAPDNRATGYAFPTPVRGYVDPEAQKLVLFGASGSMRLSVRDMAEWDRAILAGRVVTPDVWKDMSTGGTLGDGRPSGYGAGEFVSTFRGHRLVSHSGNHADATTENWILPDDHLAIVAFCNAGLTPVGNLVRAIASLYIADDAPAPAPPSPPPSQAPSQAPMPTPAMTAAARTWLERALAGTQSVFAAPTAERRRDYLADFAELGRRYGTIEGFTPVALQDRGTTLATFYSVTLHGQTYSYLYDVTAGSGVAIIPVWNP